MKEETREQKRERIHRKQAEYGWLQPTPGFANWWEPNGFNPSSGAQTGGHPDAFRRCVKPETREVAYFGTKTVITYNTTRYRDEYHQWIKDGQPEREFVDGTAGTKEQHAKCFADIKKIMKGVGKSS